MIVRSRLAVLVMGVANKIFSRMTGTSVVLTPLTLVNKGQVNPGSVNPDRSVNGVNEVNVMGSLQAPQT